MTKAMGNSDRDEALDAIFRPRSVAVIGASTNPASTTNRYFTSLLVERFKGPIYPVNPKGEKIMGLATYPHVTDIPDPVDLAIVGVPAKQTLGVIKECAVKGVKAIHLFSAGFSESGTALGRELEEDILKVARAANIRILGPNCMGVYCPSSGLAYRPSFPERRGQVGVISQSGGNNTRMVTMLTNRGVYISQAVSYGNGLDLNECDYLEYFAQDPQTRIICLYIEGTREGTRLRGILQEIARHKPVIAVKSAVTEVGISAAISHTGAIAGNDLVWEALFRQTGVLRVAELEDLADLAIAFATIPGIGGNRVGVLGGGGGAGILTADSCVRAGLRVPPLSSGLQEKLAALAPEHYVTTKNPVDFPPDFIYRGDIHGEIVSLMAQSGEVDVIVFGTLVSETQGREHIWHEITSACSQAAAEYHLPLAFVVINIGDSRDEAYACELRRKVTEEGCPAYATFRQCANALGPLVKYHLGQARA